MIAAIFRSIVPAILTVMILAALSAPKTEVSFWPGVLLAGIVVGLCGLHAFIVDATRGGR